MLKLFVEMDSRYAVSPLTQVMRIIFKDMLQTEVLVDANSIEADMAVVNTSDKALRFFKETEHTVIIIAYFGREAEVSARALASRFPERIKAVALFDHTAESDTNNFLTRITPVVDAIKAAKGG